NLSIYEEAVMCWRGEKMNEWNKALIYNAAKFDFPIHKPYNQLTREQQNLIWTGNEYFQGINAFFKWVEGQQYKIQYRVMLARYRGKTVCTECGGTRLKKEASWVKVGGKSIPELVNLPVSELVTFFAQLKLTKHEQMAAKRLLTEITTRLDFLMRVGLGYLTLNRQSNTLSGGESQRINLAKSLGSSLVGSLYVLDEPSIGLHGRDTMQLISVLKQLRDIGNTVVVVEHDELIMRAADYIIDIGPGAGRLGGNILFQSPTSQLNTIKCDESHTLNFLRGEKSIDLPVTRRKSANYIEVIGATQNNLKNINVKFPLNVLTVVTGVSGSGKSSLIRDVLYSNLKRKLNGYAEGKGTLDTIKGSFHLISNVEFVNQSPIGKSSRSNPVTYLKAYDEIRRLFAEQPYSKQMNFTPAHFSFNVDGGRCDACQGEGTVTVEMQFMADLVLTCDVCHGRRFKSDVLEANYRGKNVYDILEMTVNQAIEFFSADKSAITQRIVKRLKPLQNVGIGYLKLGQSSSTLSGGENQRVKLASFLAEESNTPTLFIFDEPTTGLHTYDIKVLLKAFDNLVAKGHSLVVIEHNMEVIKCADHIIDLGPEGGENGGYLICEGTPETVAKCTKSYTGQLLKPILTKKKS
ncbi:MAG TPA: excinuclease ABC subunit UvrA, partial [Bacteroidales bacterium]|nr:excinuclease ABC subunit UvrA [Bacteroidales bacterium]